MRYANYYTYKVSEKGDIWNKHGHKMSPYYSVTGAYVVALRVNKIREVKTVSRILYEAFNPTVDLSYKRVIFEGNPKHMHVNKLKVVSLVPGGKNHEYIYKHTRIKTKLQIIEKQQEYLKEPKKYKKELALLSWILEEK